MDNKEKFTDEESELQQQQIDITKELLKRAKAGKHSEFQFIHNLRELHATKLYIRAQRQLVRGFMRTADACMKSYLELVTNNEDNLKLIISYKEIKTCIKFYSEELNILKDMISEYVCYIHSNHLIHTLLHINRPVEDEVDFRTLPKTWF